MPEESRALPKGGLVQAEVVDFRLKCQQAIEDCQPAHANCDCRNCLYSQGVVNGIRLALGKLDEINRERQEFLSSPRNGRYGVHYHEE